MSFFQLPLQIIHNKVYLESQNFKNMITVKNILDTIPFFCFILQTRYLGRIRVFDFPKNSQEIILNKLEEKTDSKTK